MTSVRKIETFFALTVLLAGASVATAQPQEARFGNPHTPVSSDGTTVPAAAEINVDFAESFDGFGPVLETGASFYETGAAADGAMEVNESAEDVWALWENAGTSSIKGLWGGSIIGADSRTRVNP